MKRTRDWAVLGAVSKAAEILELLATAPAGMELHAVAAAMGMSASGAYRSLQSLRAHGLVSQEGRRGGYRLGPKILVLASAMRGERALMAAAEPELRSLSAASGESVNLAVMRDRQTWVLINVTGTGALVANPGRGVGEPYFHTTGRGRLFLAHMVRGEAMALIASTGLPKVGPNTITEPAALWKAVEQAKRQGYSTARGERSAHLAGIAFAVREADGALVATVGITVARTTLDAARERELVGLGLEAARRIERRLSGA